MCAGLGSFIETSMVEYPGGGASASARPHKAMRAHTLRQAAQAEHVDVRPKVGADCVSSDPLRRRMGRPNGLRRVPRDAPRCPRW